METMEITNKVLQFVEPFESPKDNSQVRKMALDALNGMDFPTTRVEDWKYTRTTRITNKTFQQRGLTALANLEQYRIKAAEMHELVFVNGYFDEKSSNILEDEGVNISMIDQLDEAYYTDLLEDVEENVFSLINKAFGTGGAYIKFLKNKKAKFPIHIIHVLSGEQTIANSRHFIQAEEGAKGEVICSYYSENSENSFQNTVLEGNIASNASIAINKLQVEEKDMFHIATETFVQDPSSNFKINTLTLGGLLVRNGLSILVEGENCYTELNGIYLGTEKQHLDNHTFVDHLYSNCTSSESYKGVMNDQSTGVFNGKVVVRPDAQKIEAYQSNGNILLSEKSQVNSKPELEIYADDVKCSHGSTTGQLDEEAVFYLRARGLSKKNAKELLVVAFIGDVLDKIENEAVRNHVDQQLKARFGWEF